MNEVESFGKPIGFQEVRSSEYDPAVSGATKMWHMDSDRRSDGFAESPHSSNGSM
jgi:hypothetical protein